VLSLCSNELTAAEKIILSTTEQNWVKAHPVLRVGNEKDWPPFDFAEDGKPKGYTVDLMRLLADKVGISIEFVSGLSWAELMTEFKAGRIDILPAIYKSKKRETFALFTSGYFSQPSVMVVRGDDNSIQSLSDLTGRTVAVISGFVISETLREQFPEARQLPVENVLAGMTAVSAGDADAFIDSVGVIGYVKRHSYIPNIKFLSRIPLEKLENPDLHMAVGKEQTVLLGILEKAIQSLTPAERLQLQKTWLQLPIQMSASQESKPLESTVPLIVQQPESLITWWVIVIAIIVIVGLAVLSRVVDRPVTEEEMAQMTGVKRFWLAVTFSNLKISAKILIILVSVAASSVALFGYLDYRETREALRVESFNKLTAVREIKAQQIKNYFGIITGQIVTFSQSRTVIDAMQQFGKTFTALKGKAVEDHSSSVPAAPELIAYYQNEFFKRLKTNVVEDLTESKAIDFIPREAYSRHLQEQYIAENQHPTGEKHRLDDSGDGSAYSKTHNFYHPIIRSFLERFGYYDIFLIDHETGHIVYSVFKEVDYATSLLTGPYRTTNFAAAFRKARNANENEFVWFEDFAPYYPSYNAPASFVASPVFDGNKKIGVLIFQMPIDRINNIMTSHNAWKNIGLGDSGETYLVGKDYFMRNQSRFLIEDRANYLKMIRKVGIPESTVYQIETLNTSIGLQQIKTKGTIDAFSGNSSIDVFPDYRHVPVLSSYRLLDLPNVQWAIMSEIDEEEAMAAAERLKARVIVLMLLFFAAILAISFAFAKTMTRPIKVLTAKAEALAKGDLGVSVAVGGGDEISQLGRSFDIMRKALAELIGGLEKKVEERTVDLTRANEELTSVSSVIVRWDPAGNILFMNSFGVSLFGFKESEILRKPLLGTIVSDVDTSSRDLKAMVGNILADPVKYESNENECICQDGSKVWVAWRNKPILDDTGSLREILSIGIDVTERKAMEKELEKANKRMTGELNVGREIQMSMVPLTFPAFPERSEFNIYAVLQPAREVGGDFYDYFFVGEDWFFFCVGDVSDKGVPAALFMAVTKTLIKSRATDDPSPASILTRVNNELSEDNNSCMFVTILVAAFNVRTGELRYSNGGHNPPYIKRADGSLECLDERHGPVIAAVGGITYKEAVAHLGHGDFMFLYTDGVTEAKGPANSLFTDEKLANLLQVNTYDSVEQMVGSTVAEVDEFQGRDHQADDITVLALQFLGNPREGEVKTLKVEIKNHPDGISVVDKKFAAFAEASNIPKVIARKIRLACDELLNNTISYAYKDDAEHSISVDMELTAECLRVTVTDDGDLFNPFEHEAPDTGASLEEREIGGLGIHLVRNLMNKVTYQRQAEKNVVTLLKYLEDEN
jgi:PAS domain S-box-containing protein